MNHIKTARQLTLPVLNKLTAKQPNESGATDVSYVVSIRAVRLTIIK
jgi:hypothetical protein